MNEHEMDATLSSWARSRGDRPAPLELRQQVLEVPLEETPPRTLWPGGRRGFDMFSAAKLVAAAAVVALFAGLLALELFATQPTEDGAPVAAPTGSMTPETTEAPAGTRIVVPRDDFAITFPPGWTAEARPMDETADATTGAFGTGPERPMDVTADAATGAFGAAPDGTAECVAHYHGDLGDEHDMVPYMEPGWNAFMEQWAARYLGDDEWPEGAGVEWDQPIPAGPATRRFIPGEPLPTAYFVTDGFGVYRVACGPGSAEPPDHWLSIAQTLELFRAERAPNGELISGPPLTSDLLLSRFITEEVEPGVTWIVYDNEHDLTGLADEGLRLLAATDGSVWSLTEGGIFPVGGLGVDFPSASIEYDEDETEPGPDVWREAVAIGRGNTIWAVRPSEGERPSLRSLELIDFLKFGQDTWALRKPAPEAGSVDGVHIEPDDTIWAWWSDSDGVTTVGRLDDVDQSYFTDVATLPATFVGGDEENGGEPRRQWPAIAIHEGTIWALTGDPVRLRRNDSSSWEGVAPLPDPEWLIRSENGHGLTVGPSGEVWVEVQRCLPIEEGSDWIECVSGLARFDEGEWTIWDWEQDPPQVPGVFDLVPGLPTAIDQDGRLWFASGDGAIWFDGGEWGRVGPRENIYALAVAPDGSVWINAGQVRDIGGETDFGPTEYYVIQPWV